METTKSMKAILDGVEVGLLTCAKGFWASKSDGSGFIKDADNKIKVFTKAQAKKGRDEYVESTTGMKPDDNYDLVMEKITQWTNDCTTYVGRLEELLGQRCGKVRNLEAMIMQSFGHVVEKPLPMLTDEQCKEMLEKDVPEIKEMVGNGCIVTAMDYLGIRKREPVLLKVGIEDLDNQTPDGKVLMSVFHLRQIQQWIKVNGDNTLLLAKLEVGKELNGIGGKKYPLPTE